MKFKIIFLFSIIAFQNLISLKAQDTIRSKDDLLFSIRNLDELLSITDTIAKLISDNYLFEERGYDIAKEFIEWSNKTFNDFPIYYTDFSENASKTLCKISSDKHFMIQATKIQTNGAYSSNNTWFGKKKGYGAAKFELMEGNISYFKYMAFNFKMVPEATKVIDRMVGMINLSDAVIIDLRDNPGGDGEMAVYFFSYFMPEDSVYLASWENRDGNNWESYTFEKLPEKRLLNKPVYILINSNTGSSAEYFAFLAKIYHKATLVGEKTFGAGHSVSTLKVNSHLTILVPSGRCYDKTTGKGWEETDGIEPDVKVESEYALDEAYKMALEKIKQ
jgi:hypothetical protein